MYSNLFHKLGLESVDMGVLLAILFAAILILLCVMIFLTMKYRDLSSRYDRFMMGKNGLDLEESFQSAFDRMERLIELNREKNKEIEGLIHSVRRTYQKTGIVKYNAAEGLGGNLSFVLALLDYEDNGFLFHVIHTGETSHIYLRQIENGACEVDLSREETDALFMAMRQEKFREFEEMLEPKRRS